MTRLVVIVLTLLCGVGDALSRVEDAARRVSVGWDTFTGAVARRAWGDLDGLAVRECAARARRETGL